MRKGIKDLRISAGYKTSKSFAAKIGIPESSWYRVETGCTKFEHLEEEIQIKVAEQLNVDASYFIKVRTVAKCKTYKMDKSKIESMLSELFGIKCEPIIAPLSQRAKCARLAKLFNYSVPL